MAPPRLGLPSLYLSIFLLALTGLFAKLIPLDATAIIQLRSMVAALGLAGFIFLQKRSFKLNRGRTYFGVYGLGVLLGLHWVTFFHAMQVSTVAVGMLAMFTFPVVTILIEPFFTGHKLKRGDLLAGLMVVSGLTIMVGSDLTDLNRPVTMGVLSGTVSAVLFALRNLLQKYRFAGETSDSLMLHQVIAVGLMLAAFVEWPRVGALDGISMLKIVLLGIFSTATAHTLLVFSLKQLPAKTVALIQCLQPLIATLLAWLVVGEVPGLSVMIGGSLILAVAAYESVQKARSG